MDHRSDSLEDVVDSVSTTQVQTLLVSEDGFKSVQIGIVTYKGRGPLSGFVLSPQAVDKAG